MSSFRAPVTLISVHRAGSRGELAEPELRAREAREEFGFGLRAARVRDPIATRYLESREVIDYLRVLGERDADCMHRFAIGSLEFGMGAIIHELQLVARGDAHAILRCTGPQYMILNTGRHWITVMYELVRPAR